MSTNYRLTVKRHADGKVIGRSYVNVVKNITNVDYLLGDNGLFLHGGTFHLGDLYGAAERLERAYAETDAEIRKMEENVYRCVSLEVKHEIEEDLPERRETLKDIRHAVNACHQMIGIVICIAEDLVLGSDGRVAAPERTADDGDEAEDGGLHTAYSLWTVKDGNGDRTPCWAEDCDLTMEAR